MRASWDALCKQQPETVPLIEQFTTTAADDTFAPNSRHYCTRTLASIESPWRRPLARRIRVVLYGTDLLLGPRKVAAYAVGDIRPLLQRELVEEHRGSRRSLELYYCGEGR